MDLPEASDDAGRKERLRCPASLIGSVWGTASKNTEAWRGLLVNELLKVGKYEEMMQTKTNGTKKPPAQAPLAAPIAAAAGSTAARLGGLQQSVEDP